MKRKKFLKQVLWGTGALSLAPFYSGCYQEQVKAQSEFTLPLMRPGSISKSNFSLVAASGKYSVGRDSHISGFRFNESYPSPTIRANKGDTLNVRFDNQIRQDSIIHWHGLVVPPEMDGHPKYAFSNGHYDYEYTINQRAGTYWYHPHPHRITGEQVYKGLAGFFIVKDDEETSLNLPDGEFELPLLIQDRRVNPTGEILYNPTMPEQMMTGFLGDHILINGVPTPYQTVKKGVYRLRLLNGSNARIFNIAFQSNRSFTLIGSDGGLLPKAVEVDRLLLAPGERADILVDFSALDQETATLVSLPFEVPSAGGMMNGMGNMMGGSGPDQGTGFTLMQFRITNESGYTVPSLPSVLYSSDFPEPEDAELTRQIDLDMQMMQGHTINGKLFEMERVDVQVNQGSTEIWEFVNLSGIPHPMHIHAVQFRVLERTGNRGILPSETGWKDTVLVMPNERVKVIMTFDAPKGMYVFHCHNLEHEDSGMMGNFEIT